MLVDTLLLLLTRLLALSPIRRQSISLPLLVNMASPSVGRPLIVVTTPRQLIPTDS